MARLVLAGLPHHVVQRGNNRQDVFFVDDDRRTYLDFLAGQSERFGMKIMAYCLLTNHVHLVVVPARDGLLAAAIGRTHWLYSQYINRLHRRSGHLWQNRFFSAPMDETYLQRVCLYVERNPVRAKRVRLPWRYAWSSAAAHVGDVASPRWLDVNAWRGLCQTHRWREQLLRPEDEETLGPLRLAIRTGRPLATDSMLAKIKRVLGRRLRARPVGRPKKAMKGKSRKGKPIRRKK